jgi:cytochrome c biogenesis factor
VSTFSKQCSKTLKLEKRLATLSCCPLEYKLDETTQMYIELSHYLLMLAVFLAFNLKHSKMVWMMSLYLVLVTLAFFTAIACYMCSDFSISNLFTNSNANTPLFFQIAATWSNHEGSLLLWCWLLSVYGFWFCYMVQPWNSSLHSLQHEVSYVRKLGPKVGALGGSEKERPLRIQALFIYVYILIFFHAFLLTTSNPFLKIPFLCVNSVAELNPVLQDPILAIHPPCIYAGYVASAIGFSICLSKCMQAVATPLKQTNGIMACFSVSAANGHRVCTKTTHFWTEMWTQIRVWILTCWCFLTIGILLGSWWAYHELGWGGWWFWDPVENASLMPWLLATACIHSVLVPRLNGWTLCLNQLTFMLSVLGTFFVRSGLLASVHSFATDSTRGLYLLCFLVAILAISVMYLGFYSSLKSGMKPLDAHKLKHDLRSQGTSAAKLLRMIETPKEVARSGRGGCEKRGGCLSIKMNSHLFTSCLSTVMVAATSPRVYPEKEVAVHQNGQTDMRKEVADSNLYECQPPLFPLRASFFTRSGRGTKWKRWLTLTSMNASHLFSHGCGHHSGKARSEEVAVHLNGQTATSFFTATSPTSCEERGGCLSIMMYSHLFLTSCHLFSSLFTVLPRSHHCLLTKGQSISYHGSAACSQRLGSTASADSAQDRLKAAQHLIPSDSSTPPHLGATRVFAHSCLSSSVRSATFLLKEAKFYAVQKTQGTGTQMEQLMKMQNSGFFLICVVVLCGTAAPILFQVFFKRDVSTGAPFFNGTIIPLFTSITLLLVYVHFVVYSAICRRESSCNRSDKAYVLKVLGKKELFFLATHMMKLKQVIVSFVERRFSTPTKNLRIYSVLLLMVLHWFVFKFFGGLSCLESVYAVICFVLFCSVLLVLCVETSTQTRHEAAEKRSRLVAFSAPWKPISLNMQTAHTGILLFLTGVLVSNRHQTQLTQIMRSGSAVRLGHHICALRGIDHNYGPTFRSICGNLVVYQQLANQRPTMTSVQSVFNHSWTHRFSSPKFSGPPQGSLKEPFQQAFGLFPEKRFYFSNQELSTTKVAIHSNMFSDIYALIGAGSAETGWFVTIMQLPFIGCIWVGFLLAALGGLKSVLSLFSWKRKLNWL